MYVDQASYFLKSWFLALCVKNDTCSEPGRIVYQEAYNSGIYSLYLLFRSSCFGLGTLVVYLSVYRKLFSTTEYFGDSLKIRCGFVGNLCLARYILV